MATTICPACGYPSIGSTLCAFCRPVEALTEEQMFEPNVLATTLRRGPM